MLSRIAESLFWIGRYVERADGTARILDVHLERLNHLPMDERRNVAQELLAVMGARPQSEDFGLPELLHALAYDKTSATSLAGSLGADRVLRTMGEPEHHVLRPEPAPQGRGGDVPFLQLDTGTDGHGQRTGRHHRKPR